ncbi:g11043 [Coccomyxa elongata]
MPKRRQQKVLSSVPEDEELIDEAPTLKSKELDESILQRIDGIEQQVQERAQELLDAAEAECRAIDNLFAVQLVKLPKSVREMPLVQFTSDYGSDINAVLLESIKRASAAQVAPSTVAQGLSAVATVTRTTRKRAKASDPAHQESGVLMLTSSKEVKGHKKNRVVLDDMKENAVAETPAVGPSSRDIPFTPAVPATLMRVPKLGETFYSQKGSPLGVFEQDPLTKQTVLNTVAKGGTSLMTPMPGALQNTKNMVATILNRKKGSRKGVADSMVVTTSDGEVVTVDLASGLDSVPEQYRKEVANQLEELRNLATLALTNVTRRR